MKIFSMVLASAAVLAAPMAASAQGFDHGHAAFRGLAHVEGRAGFAGRVGFEPRPFARDFHGARWAVGAILPSLYWDAYLSDPYAYGLTAAPYGAHWVYMDDQALLIQNRTGAILEVAPI
jgi:Ni/Co efflux regulator RcnB